MARPKRGEKGHDEAVRKWRETMLARYGTEEEMHRQMVEKGRKGGHNGKTGGFASNKVGADGMTGLERAVICGAIGGKKSRRGPARRANAEV